MSLPLLITDDEHVPIYLQLVHQIRYLITSRELPADAQLPSVRSLARTLGVNAGTVAQAYRALQSEGLIDTQRGRGTFVAPIPDAAGRTSHRQALLSDLVDDFATRAFALGFDPATVRQAVGMHLQGRVRTMSIVLVARSSETAEKYARLVAPALPDDLLATVIPATFDQLEAGERWLVEAYHRVYFTIVAFMPNVPTVEASLRAHGIRSETVGLTASLTPEAIGRLRDLDPRRSHALVTEARNVNSALSLVGQHSRLDLRKVRILTELAGGAQLADLEGTDVIHTFGVVDLLDRLEIPAERRIELAFTLSEDSVARLKQTIPAHPLALGA